jgi:hypothetical protein
MQVGQVPEIFLWNYAVRFVAKGSPLFERQQRLLSDGANTKYRKRHEEEVGLRHKLKRIHLHIDKLSERKLIGKEKS